MKFDPCDSVEFVHCFALSKFPRAVACGAVWQELRLCLDGEGGERLEGGSTLDKSIALLRGFVTESTRA
jgi:hypothetical protein